MRLHYEITLDCILIQLRAFTVFIQLEDTTKEGKVNKVYSLLSRTSRGEDGYTEKILYRECNNRVINKLLNEYIKSRS